MNDKNTFSSIKHYISIQTSSYVRKKGKIISEFDLNSWRNKSREKQSQWELILWNWPAKYREVTNSRWIFWMEDKLRKLIPLDLQKCVGWKLHYFLDIFIWYDIKVKFWLKILLGKTDVLALQLELSLTKPKISLVALNSYCCSKIDSFLK